MIMSLAQPTREGFEARTLCTICDLVVGLLVWSRAIRLHAHIPYASPEHGDGDQAVSSRTPEVLDQEVLRPLVCYPDL